MARDDSTPPDPLPPALASLASGLAPTQQSALLDVIEQLNEAVFLLDREFRYELVNAAGEQMSRRPRAELLGRSMWSIFPDREHTPSAKAMKRAIAEGAAVRTEVRNEAWRSWFEVSSYPTSHGGLLVVCRDVTRRKQDELIVDGQREAMARTLRGAPMSEVLEVLVHTAEAFSLGAMRGSILLLDPDGTRLRHGAAPSLPDSYNRAIDGVEIGVDIGTCGRAAATLRTTVTTDIEKDPRWAQFRHLALPVGLRSAVSLPIRSSLGRLLGTFGAYGLKPGDPHPDDLTALELLANTAAVVIERDSEVRERLGTEVRLASAMEDLSQQVVGLQGIHALALEVARLDSLSDKLREIVATNTRFHSATHGVLWLFDLETHAVRLGASAGYDAAQNAEWAKWLPMALSGPTGRTFTSGARVIVTDTETDPDYTSAREVARRFGFRAAHSTPIRSREGQLLGMLSVHFKSPRGTGDLERKLADMCANYAAEAIQAERGRNELRRAKEIAEAASRTKDEFLAMLGHELRNPLAPLVTALELSRLPNGPALDAKLVERHVGHLVRLVEDLLDVSRITRGQVTLKNEPIELFGVVTRAIEMASPLIEQKSHRLEVDVAEHGLVVDGDAVRLAQVVSNLLTNAAKYTPPRGHLQLVARRAGAAVELSVRDDGTGIAPELLPRVFDLFVQGDQAIDRAPGGLGLGLTIVKSLMQLHGGSVEARSAGVGQGSEFVVRLPASAAPPQEVGRRRSRSLPTFDVAKGPMRVLVVDDNADAAELLVELLESLGHEAKCAFDGPSAFELVGKGFKPEVALVDIGLPVMDGYQVGTRLRALPGLEQLQVVAVTGYGQSSDREKSVKAGFLDHLVKPLAFDALTAVLARASQARA